VAITVLGGVVLTNRNNSRAENIVTDGTALFIELFTLGSSLSYIEYTDFNSNSKYGRYSFSENIQGSSSPVYFTFRYAHRQNYTNKYDLLFLENCFFVLGDHPFSITIDLVDGWQFSHTLPSNNHDIGHLSGERDLIDFSFNMFAPHGAYVATNFNVPGFAFKYYYDFDYSFSNDDKTATITTTSSGQVYPGHGHYGGYYRTQFPGTDESAYYRYIIKAYMPVVQYQRNNISAHISMDE
jgi:hypothetical protein